MKNFPKNCLRCLLFTLLLVLKMAVVQAQTTDSIPVKIILHDGTELIGTIKKEDATNILLDSELVGEVNIPRTAVQMVIPLERMGAGGKYRFNYWKKSPLEATNLGGPTGFGQRKGSGYFRNSLLFFNQFNYGVTDHVSIGIGSFLVPVIMPSMVSVKLSMPYKTGKGSVALMGSYFSSGPFFVFETDSGSQNFFSLYGLNSWGTRANQLTVGTGYAFRKGAGNDRYFFYSASYLRRWNARYAFLTENHFLRTPTGFTVPTSAAVRYFKKRIALEIGVAVVVTRYLAPRPFFSPEETTVAPLPWFSIARPFNKNVKNRQTIK